MKPLVRTALRAVLTGAMVVIGIMHFTKEEFFVKIVPSWLPEPRLLVQLSGIAEILLGVLVLIPKTRRLAGWGLTALFVAVFPANVNMVLHPELGGTLPHWALWARLPFQALFIAYALWITEALPKRASAAGGPQPEAR